MNRIVEALEGLSVVVPAYNEAARLRPTLEAVADWLRRNVKGGEIVVSDDGSTDGTRQIAEAFATGSPVPVRVVGGVRNEGKGAAVRRGVLAARGRYVLYSDADLSTPIEEVEKLYAALARGADLAFGSRSIRGARVERRQPLYRMLMGKTFNKIVRLVTGLDVVDSQCGFKLMRREVATALFEQMRLDGFAFDVELIYLARRQGLRIAEVPVRWINDPASKVDPIRHSAEMLRDVLRIPLLHRGAPAD